MKNKVMVAGHICLDICPQFPEGTDSDIAGLLSPGKLVNLEEAVLSTGGAVSNTGMTMAKLGLDVVFNAKVGDDYFGTIIKQLVGDRRATSFKTVSGQNTSYTIALAVPDNDRILLHNPGTNDTFTADDIDYEMAGKCDLFHFGYPTLMKQMYKNQGSELVKIFKKIKKSGCVTCMDMTLPDASSESGKMDWQIILANVLPFVDIFLPSIEEIAYILNRDLFEERRKQADRDDPVLYYTPDDCSALSEKLIDMGVKVVVLKNGIRGLYLRTAKKERLADIACLNSDVWSQRELWCPSYKTDVFSSTVGTGDITIAGFLTALIRGFSPDKSLQIANILGWQNVKVIDALSGIKDWQTTLNLLKNNTLAQNQTNLNNNWRYNPDKQIFEIDNSSS